MKKVFAAICWFFLVQNAGFADASVKNGPPNPDEIIGYWKLTAWPVQGMNRVNPWPQPHQYFAFYADGQIVTIMSSMDQTPKPSDLDQVKEIFGDKNPTYKWYKNFIVVRQLTIPNYSETWGMNIFRKAEPQLSFGKGDLVMTLAGGDNGEPVYYRWLTRID